MSRYPVHLLAIVCSTLILCGCSSDTGPSGLALTVTPASIAPGAVATLTWTAIADATTCTIDNGVGTVPCTGSSKTVEPAVTTTYTLTATGTGGSKTSTATVTVSSVTTPTATGITPVTPIMGTFTATPTTVAPGGQTTLSWKGILLADHCLIDNNVGLVPCSDSSIRVTPQMPADGSSVVTYTFWAIGIDASVPATVNITLTH